MRIIGYDFYGELNGGMFYNGGVVENQWDSLSMYSGLIDQVFLDKNGSLNLQTSKVVPFLVSTILTGKFEGSLDAGNVDVYGNTLTDIKIQKRKANETEWIDVALIPFDKVIEQYIFNDQNIQFEQDYYYSIIPMSGQLYGRRIISDKIAPTFDGVFISDKDNNIHLLYNIEYKDITKVTQYKTHETMGRKYPIITSSALDYTVFGISAWIITQDSIDGIVNVASQKIEQDRILKFLNDKRPKIYKDSKGDLKLVSISENVTISPIQHCEGLFQININMTEIGDATDNTDLLEMNLV